MKICMWKQHCTKKNAESGFYIYIIEQKISTRVMKRIPYRSGMNAD